MNHYKFYCPSCKEPISDVDFSSDTQMVSLPVNALIDKKKDYELHFITCNKCQTVLNTVAVPYIGQWTKD